MNKYKVFIKEILFLIGEDKKKLPKFLIFFLILSMIDILGIGLIAPYISLVASPENFFESSFSSLIFSIGFPSSHDDLLIFFGIILIGIFLAKSVISLMVQKSILNFSVNRETTLRALLMKSYQDLPIVELSNRDKSEFVYSINTLAAEFSNSLQTILRIISEVIVGFFIFIVLALTDIKALLLLAFVMIIVVLTYDFFYRKKIHMSGQASVKHSTKMIQSINENIDGIHEIKVYNKEQFFLDKMLNHAKKYAYFSVLFNIISIMPRYFLEFVLVSFIALLVMIYVLLGQDLTLILPILGVFGVAAIRLVPSANQIINGLVILRHSRYGIHLLYSDLSNKKNSKSLSIQESKEAGGFNFKNLELKDISFSYPNSTIKTISNLSLNIKKNQSIGIIGESGSGKTTLINILLGLIEINDGEILFNNKLSTLSLSKWLEKVAYLPQQAFLINDSLVSNIALGQEKEKIDLKRINLAVKKAYLEDYVRNLPDGLNTILGEQGAKLSGGQKQRVAIARAFYFNRKILVLDESTSSLDNKIESQIIDEIEMNRNELTTIIISHRLSTLKNCDVIYKLHNGKIITEGSYNEIINKT